MANSLTNVSTYFIIITLSLIFIGGSVAVSRELLTHSEAELDEDSIIYGSGIIGIDMSGYNVSEADIEESVVGNVSGATTQDFSADFLFGRSKTTGVINQIKGVFNLPKTFLVRYLRLKEDGWEWVYQSINWLLWISIVVAGIYFARGILER